jgi:four helix bundle protein
LLPGNATVARDHRKLHVFQLADSLLLGIYRATTGFPAAERYGLTGQLRRSALSVASNIVEGSARRTTREYVNFLNQANGSAAETRYLLSVAHRLELLRDQDFLPAEQYSEVQRGLQAMINTLECRD